MKPKYLLFLSIIFAVTLACSLSSGASTPEGLESIVAATLTALARDSSPTPAAQGTPTETPVLETSEPTQPSAPASVGLKVVYIKDGNIWLWTQDSATRILTASGPVYSLRLSPDGQIVAFLRQVGGIHTELWAINIDGSNERRLVSVADLDALNASVRDPNAIAVLPYRFKWAPGTHTLAFNTHQVFEGPGLFTFDDFHLVDADTLELTTLFPAGQGGEFVYSSDGSKIAIITPSTISLVNADGGDRFVVLDYEPVITYSEYHYYARPRWDPDSSALRVAIPPADPLAQPRQPTSLWLIPTDGSPASLVGSVFSVPFFEQEVAFSPDLSYIIYLVEIGAPAENQRELHIAKADGSGGWVYQKGQLLQFAGWAIDSTHFNFRLEEDRQMQLGQIDVGSEPFTDDPSGIHDVRWVDEKLYLYLRESAGVFDFYLAELRGPAILIDTLAEPPPAYDYFIQTTGN